VKGKKMDKDLSLLKAFSSPKEIDKILTLREEKALSKIPLKIKYEDRSRKTSCKSDQKQTA
jgi:hypothetical protein